eukprot:GFUD01009572.1.p1 GENE.GFUD01009572.1~~GFUD01009572.1.p1  ORF type:complete len:955 (+),score=275.94 GFUD01009572.1:1124-3988(+)
MAQSRDTSGHRSPQASTSYPRQEEARPFPLMAPTPPPSTTPHSMSSSPSRDDSCERDASANFSGRDSTELSPAGGSAVHPGEGGIFNFNSSEGGPVRLTNLTPISPTNEDVYNSSELRSNPQPPISNSFLQVLSPSRPVGVGGYPFLFTGQHPPIFSMQENEKYRKLMLKKQKRVSKKEKNVLNVFKAEDIEGHKGEEDLNSVLQSMGEKVEEKKVKVKKPREKIEKAKTDKRERGKRSVEKELGDYKEEEEEEIVEEMEKQEEENLKPVNKARNKFVDEDLVAFKNNFYLVTPEPGPLARHKSRECLSGSVESLPGLNSSPQMSFTKVTNKKHRTKRSKEETGKPPPGPAAPPDARRAGYALRSRDTNTGGVVREQAGSPTESVISQGESNTHSTRQVLETQLSLESQNFPKLEKDDFPALPGGKGRKEKSEVSLNNALPSAWARVVTKASDNIVTIESSVDREVTKASDNIVTIENSFSKDDAFTNGDIVTESSKLLRSDIEKEDFEDLVKASNAVNASDDMAVIDCDVPSVSPDHDGSETDIKPDSVAASEMKDRGESGDEQVSANTTNIYADLTNFPNNGDADLEKDVASVADEIENIEVITSEDEFNRRKADNSAPVVIFSENDQDWTSAEFTFGFDVNEELLVNSSTLTSMETSHAMTPHQQPHQMWTMSGMPGPMAPLTPIDTVDGAILSFGGPDPMRPLIVGVPVGVPVPVGDLPNMPPLPFYSQFANGVLPPPFPAYGLSYTHQLPQQGAVIHHHQFHEDEPELDGEKGGVHDQNGEDQTISPESGISSASPLSWQPDSSPSLPAPGSYPHPRDGGRDGPAPLVSHVSQSLSSWQGHCSVHSESSNSSRSSPAPGWATQVDIEDDIQSGKVMRELDTDKTNDSGLASENSNSLLEKDLKQKNAEKFNLGEIVNFISSSWSSVSQDSSVAVFTVANHGHSQTNVVA